MRKYAPVFHKWNGRTYLVMVVITSLFGTYMIWTRGTTGGLIRHPGTSFNALLILVFSVLVIRNAMLKKIDTHMKWAWRLFIAVNGVWFFRVGLMFWLLVNQGPVGFDPNTFEGPFLSFWTFGQYLLPLVILELYFLTAKKANQSQKLLVSALMLISIIAMSIGIFGATVGMWIPNM